MMDPQTIRHNQQEARQRASAENLTPYLVTKDDIAEWKNGKGLPLPFPDIGDYDPPNFEEYGARLFCDTSGFGLDDELSLTTDQLLDALQVDIAYAIVEIGQFQLYIQGFKRVWRKS